MNQDFRVLERSGETVSSTADVLEFPFAEVRRQIVRASSLCATLRQTIASIRRRLEAIKDEIGKVDDHEAREALGHVLASMTTALRLRSEQLSDIEKSLEDTLRRTHQPRGG